MQRRTFVKHSVAAAVLTPLALTGLINAAGATETGETTETTWFTTTELLTTTHILQWDECEVSVQEYVIQDTDGVNRCFRYAECTIEGRINGEQLHAAFNVEVCPLYDPNGSPNNARAWACMNLPYALNGMPEYDCDGMLP
jgi:hypothetical protein